MFDEGATRPTCRRLHYDVCPNVWSNRIGGYTSRASDQSVVNIATGGTFVCPWILEGDGVD